MERKCTSPLSDRFNELRLFMLKTLGFNVKHYPHRDKREDMKGETAGPLFWISLKNRDGQPRSKCMPHAVDKPNVIMMISKYTPFHAL